jgi:tyrosine-protein kinase Etk/Wzc
MPEGSNVINKPAQQRTSPRELVYKYIRYIPWLAISVAIMLVLAYLKLYYSTPMYNVSGKMLVTSGGSTRGAEKFDDIFMTQGSIKINDEIEIIKSRPIAARVIKHLSIQNSIVNKGKIRSTTVHPLEAPFRIDIVSPEDSTSGFNVIIKVSDNYYTIGDEPTQHAYGEIITIKDFKLRILRTDIDLKNFSSNEFIISRSSMQSMAAQLKSSINVAPANDFTNVLTISYTTENIRMGVDIVNQFMKEYQQNSLEDKRQIAANALDFISQQLDTAKLDLGRVEGNLQRFRESNRIVNPEQQASVYLGQLTESDKLIAEQLVKIRVVEYLNRILADKNDPYKIVPSMLGTDEPVLLQQITEYNRLQLERETAVKTIPAGNPLIQNLESSIEKLRGNMLANLRNISQTYQIIYSDLVKNNKEADARLAKMPSKEKQLLEVRRQQSILQELYSYLLQKKLETAIGSAATVSNIKVVESAMASGQISPNKNALYLMALIIGLGIPVGIIAIKEILNDKVVSKADIQHATDAPILGEIGHAEDSTTLVVTLNNRKFLAEQFRSVRSNLQYILPKVDKPVIMITSSFSGEGKSFVSTNLGAVLALSGKRTVILEFDIRKPKIMKGLRMRERKGITNYIVGNVGIEEIIYSVPEVENLYVIPCGPVPPNPAEMLLSEKVHELFRELGSQFDSIIIDTAPVGVVSDAITLGSYADATVYIVRHNYTVKKQVQLIDDIYRHQKLPNLSIIINDIDSRGGYGGYYGYGGYGYGYGYGYGAKHGSGYFEGENGSASRKKKGKKWFRSEK